MGAIVTSGLAGTAGCSSSPRTEPVTRNDAVLLSRDALAVEYVGDIDRYTWFGPDAGPNLLHIQGLDRTPAPDEAYTFWGGCYTWVGPQKGWAGPDGASREWPPDPAMDVGPGIVTGRGTDWFETRTPVNRLGLREVKRFTIEGADRARLSYTLENVADATVVCAPWINTAVGRGSVIALRYVEGRTPIWGWDDQTIARFKSIAQPIDGTDWVILDLARADWPGGGKVWLDTASEIAVWTDGHWLHRRVEGSIDGARLREVGEGSVAVYIQPGKDGADWIVEAELYGRVVDLAPLRSVTMIEHWDVVLGGRHDVSGLD